MNEISTSESLTDFVTAMRDELQQYGEMLARLDDLENTKIRGPFQEGLTTAVHNQAIVIQATRRHRVEIEGQLANHLGLPADVSLAEIVDSVPWSYQPLVQALMDENNELPLRIQRRACQGDQCSNPLGVFNCFS